MAKIWDGVSDIKKYDIVLCNGAYYIVYQTNKNDCVILSNPDKKLSISKARLLPPKLTRWALEVGAHLKRRLDAWEKKNDPKSQYPVLEFPMVPVNAEVNGGGIS
jgi:hypothetical protein